MNIHINKEEFDFLITQKNYGVFTIGSPLYNLQHEKSDTDKLVILKPFTNYIHNPFTNHHQFQYKDVENNIDYNFVDINGFVKNLVSGDSTINFELLYTNQFIDTDLYFLEAYRSSFITYNIIKAYLGFADRDLKHSYKKEGDDKISCVKHIMRGIIFSAMLLEKPEDFNLDCSGYKIINNMKDLSELEVFYENIGSWKHTIKEMRNELNTKMEKKEIQRFLKPALQDVISDRLLKCVELNNELPKSLLFKIYETNENPELRYN